MSQDGMHGRKKERFTEEQLAASKLKQERKIAEYKSLCEQYYQKRKLNELNDEAFHLTSAILSINQEYYSVWNFRRTILVSNFAKQDSATNQLKCLSELRFCDDALKRNPKSYWVFNHRRWILEMMPEAAWSRELALIEMMLNLDPRNFHGWDYRRYMMDRSNLRSKKEELDYTTLKINQNFSNFSAWHYRSKILVDAIPDPVEREKFIQNDFEIVRNAVYTEPADQSAWLYQRWLLGDEKFPVLLEKTWVEKNYITLQFNQDVLISKDNKIIVLFDDLPLTTTLTGGDPASQMSRIWFIETGLSTANHILIEIPENNISNTHKHFNTKITISGPPENLAILQTVIEVPNNFQPLHIWERERASVQELFDFEPTSKWPALTLLHIVKKLKDYSASIDLCHKLCVIDPLRTGYYRDIESRMLMDRDTKPSDLEIHLSGQNLTTISLTNAFPSTHTLDLSNNQLTCITSFYLFVSIETLNLDNNELVNLEGIQSCRKLKSFTLKNNRINKWTLFDVLSECKSLREINVEGNPVCREMISLDILSELKKRIPQLNETK